MKRISILAALVFGLACVSATAAACPKDGKDDKEGKSLFCPKDGKDDKDDKPTS